MVATVYDEKWEKDLLVDPSAVAVHVVPGVVAVVFFVTQAGHLGRRRRRCILGGGRIPPLFGRRAGFVVAQSASALQSLLLQYVGMVLVYDLLQELSNVVW